MLPNCIIIGAMKCGTSSLYYYLSRHPQIRMSREKELSFFVEERNWDRGVEWYEGQFERRGGVKVYGEASPCYSYYPEHKDVPAKMYALVPNVRIIYLVRDPIDRVVTHYVNYYSAGRENNPFPEALADLNRNYIWRSSYCMQLEQYLSYFSLSQFLIVDRDDLLHNRRQTLRRIFTFLEVESNFDSPCFDKIKGESRLRRRTMPLPQTILTSRPVHFAGCVLTRRVRRAIKKTVYYPFSHSIQRPIVDAALRERLTDALKPDADRLRQLTGRDFAHWSV